MPTIEQGGSSLYPSLAQRATSVDVLRIVISIGPTETMHFQTWSDKWSFTGARAIPGSQMAAAAARPPARPERVLYGNEVESGSPWFFIHIDHVATERFSKLKKILTGPFLTGRS